MAETSSQDVVKQAQSVGDTSSADVSGPNHTSSGAGAGDAEPGRVVGTEHGTDGPPPSTDSQNVAELGSPRADLHTGHEQVTSVNKATNDYTHVNGGDSASYTGSEDNSYQRSTDGDALNGDFQGPAGNNWRQRSNSFAKKPTSFKPVSVTKNYLAKTGTAAPINMKTAMDKNVAGAQPSLANASAAKPRLVAKLGRDKLSSALSGAPSVGGPDASKVWNRNKREHQQLRPLIS